MSANFNVSTNTITYKSSIKKDRERVEKHYCNATKDYSNAVQGNTLFPTSNSKKQIIVDEKKAVMEMWKVKLNEAVSSSSNAKSPIF